MKIPFVILVTFLYAAHGVPSRRVADDSPTHSVKKDLSDDIFIEEIPDDSLRTHGEYAPDAKIKTVGYNHEHTYEDFSTDIGRYPEYEQIRSFGFEDVLPTDVRVSGLSMEDQQREEYEGAEPSDAPEDRQSTSRNLRHGKQDSENLGASAGLGHDLGKSGEEVEDVTVQGLSDYSYLVGDKLHGVNELRAVGVMHGGRKVRFDVEDSEELQDFDYDVEKDEDLDYTEFLEEEDREVQDHEYDHEGVYDYGPETDNDEYDHEGVYDYDHENDNDEYDHEREYEYDHAAEVIIRGQAVEDEDDEEFEEDDDLYDSERYEDDEYDDDSHDYDEDEDDDEDEDVEIDTRARTADADDDGEYYEDEDEIDEGNEEDNQMEAKMKGMSLGVLEDDEDEEFDDEDFDEEEFDDEDEDEYDNNLPRTGRQGDEEEDEYEDGYVREWDDDDENDEDWDEEDDFDSTSRDVELEEDIPEVDDPEAYENLHGDAVKPDIKTVKLK